MSYSAERASIEGRLFTAWAGRTPIGFDGQAFEPAINSIRLTILNGAAGNASIGSPGSNLVRYAGVIAIQIFTEGGKGTGASRVFEDALSDIFRNQTFDGIRCGVPCVSGSLEEPPFMMRTLMVPFSRDSLHG